ncbi:MAG: TetR/AcrR family transcriptional regulator [Acidobacteriaceae bacterium]
MPPFTRTPLTPRKTPIQARSSASVEAILQATLQVLVSVGKERLTTTRVAQRAGVSVGTLYQYYPNKSSLLQAALRLHMDQVAAALDQVCTQYQNQPLLIMADALLHAYLNAKMQHVKASASLYSVSSDIDGAAIAKAASARGLRAVTTLFTSAPEPLTKDPTLIATVVVASFNGIARRILEAKSPERELEPLRTELTVLVHAYLRTCIAA